MAKPLAYIEYKNRYLLNLQTNNRWSFIAFKYLIPRTFTTISTSQSCSNKRDIKSS
jgi:hypothetical protein